MWGATGGIDFDGREKYDHWKECAGMDKERAKFEFVRVSLAVRCHYIRWPPSARATSMTCHSSAFEFHSRVDDTHVPSSAPAPTGLLGVQRQGSLPGHPWRSRVAEWLMLPMTCFGSTLTAAALTSSCFPCCYVCTACASSGGVNVICIYHYWAVLSVPYAHGSGAVRDPKHNQDRCYWSWMGDVLSRWPGHAVLQMRESIGRSGCRRAFPRF